MDLYNSLYFDNIKMIFSTYHLSNLIFHLLFIYSSNFPFLPSSFIYYTLLHPISRCISSRQLHSIVIPKTTFHSQFLHILLLKSQISSLLFFISNFIAYVQTDLRILIKVCKLFIFHFSICPFLEDISSFGHF